MKRSSYRYLFVIMVLAFVAALLPFSVWAEGKVLTIGKITNNPKKHYGRVKAYGDYLVQGLASLGYSQVEVIFTKSTSEMAELFCEGKVDLLSETVYSAAYLMHYGDAQPLLREWRNGVVIYNSMLFAMEDAPLTSIVDLEGRIVAFEDPDSTSGYILPAFEIERAGFELVEMEFPLAKDSLDEGQVGFVFAQSEKAIKMWVEKGEVDAGALSNLHLTKAKRKRPDLRVKIIHSSPAYPRAVLMVNSQLDQAVTEQIRSVLLEAHLHGEGQVAMDKYKDVTKYDPLPEEDLHALEWVMGRIQ